MDSKQDTATQQPQTQRSNFAKLNHWQSLLDEISSKKQEPTSRTPTSFSPKPLQLDPSRSRSLSDVIAKQANFVGATSGMSPMSPRSPRSPRDNINNSGDNESSRRGEVVNRPLAVPHKPAVPPRRQGLVKIQQPITPEENYENQMEEKTIPSPVITESDEDSLNDNTPIVLPPMPKHKPVKPRILSLSNKPRSRSAMAFSPQDFLLDSPHGMDFPISFDDDDNDVSSTMTDEETIANVVKQITESVARANGEDEMKYLTPFVSNSSFTNLSDPNASDTYTDFTSEIPELDDDEDEDYESEDSHDEEEYNKNVLERLHKHRTMANLEDYRDILSEDEQTSIKRASISTTNQIQREISMILGQVRSWSSESEEVRSFRERMKLMRTIDSETPLDKHALLPRPNLTIDPAAANCSNKELICRVYLPNSNSFKTMTCSPKTTADEFLEKFKLKMMSDVNANMHTDQVLFKASGFADYIYGKHPMIMFDYVWGCVKKDARVILTLVDWDQIWSELDPHDLSLKSISYDARKVENYYNRTDRVKLAWDVNEPFRIKLCRIDNICLREVEHGAKPHPELYVVAQLCMGNIGLTDQHFSQAVEIDKDKCGIWGQYINFPQILVSELPRETTLRIICYSRPKGTHQIMTSIGSKDIPVASVTVPVYGHDGVLKSGKSKYNMWLELKPFSNSENHDPNSTPSILDIEYDQRNYSVVFPEDENKIPPEIAERWVVYEQKRMQKYPKISHSNLLKEYERIINTDPLYQLNEEERYRLWSVRSSAQLLTSNPKALFKFMQSVPWKYPQAVFIAHQLLDKWAQIDPIDSLELLNYNFADQKLRRHAVRVLSRLSDVELKELLLQLVQSLKFELYHDSALARFLIEKALQSTHLIGHVLFWHLKSEMHDPCIRERFGVILEEYLLNCGSHRRELMKQNGIVEQLLDIAMIIKETKKADQLTVLKEKLKTLALPPKFKLPLSTRVEAKGIIVEKCKVMNSKKLPLWLVFENADTTGEPIYVIFKAGDDLRQDLLTLQILRNMDLLWKGYSHNLRLNPYGCVCLGDMIGMIEVVTNSDTVANITHERGGASAAFTVDPLTVWLQKHNTSQGAWETCVQNFVKSCAGYCVATYVLGIGDRHNDNIMLTKKGDLFHIDFGHFLGNFKQFKGIYKRETTPFVFTPMYAHVMGGKDSSAFDQFVDLGCEAFLILRRHHRMLMNLFLLMLAAGIPELTSLQDIMWLRKVLVLEKNDEKAKKHFKSQVKKSLKNTRARINDAVHIYAKK